MRRFLNNLVRNFRTAKAARPTRRLPRRTMLQLESLEDRLVPTTVSLSGSTLTVSNVGQNHFISFQGYGNDGMQVLDNGQSVYTNTNKQSVSTVNVQTANYGVGVNDSNGMPFAYGTTVNLSSSGGTDLELSGSRAVSGNELYVAGGAPWTSGMIQLDNITFNLAPSVSSVKDTIQITGTFDVQTSGLTVSNSEEFGTAQLSGLGSGGGGSLNYESKPHVVLEEYSAGAGVYTYSYGESQEQTFVVNLHGTSDIATINGTQSNVTTVVNTVIGPVANQADVYVWANTGSVIVNGNSSTYVALGPAQTGTAQNIQGAVVVNGAGTLSILDPSNTSQENVTVTPGTISGSGLFGNNNVILYYDQVGAVYIDAGTAENVFSIVTNSTYPTFSSSINIDDNSSTKFVSFVGVDSSSNLNLHLYNFATPQNEAELLFVPQSGESIGIFGRPNGVADISAANGAITGSVSYQGFGVVKEI